MRTLRLVRHLSASGWFVDVVTISPDRYRKGTVVDPALLETVPTAVEVIHARAWRPFERLTALVRGRRTGLSAGAAVAASQDHAPLKKPVALIAAIRACLAMPDREISWLLPAVAAALRRARAPRPDAIH
jgi:hypothetical protein